MCSKRDMVIFAAGALALHTISHLTLQFSHILPLKMFGFTLTSDLNMYAIGGSAVITIALLWWASKLK